MPEADHPRPIPWIAHLLVLALVVGALAFTLPLLLPLLAVPLATFAALSTLLFPLCRHSFRLFLLNYAVSGIAAAVLYFTG